MNANKIEKGQGFPVLFSIFAFDFHNKIYVMSIYLRLEGPEDY